MTIIAFILGFLILLETIAAADRINFKQQKWMALKVISCMLSGLSGLFAWRFGGANWVNVIMLIAVFFCLWNDGFYRLIAAIQKFYPKYYQLIKRKYNISERRQEDKAQA